MRIIILRVEYRGCWRHMTYDIPPVVVVVAPPPVHPLPHHVGDELAAPGKLAAQLRVATIAQNPE